MTGETIKKLKIEGVSESWLSPDDPSAVEGSSYRPAVLIECSVNFRSLRAGLNHSEERSYIAWLPEGDLAIDWDAPPKFSFDDRLPITNHPDPRIPYREGNYQTTVAELEQYESELIDKLVRNERLRIYFNPVFGIFSAPEDDVKDFLARIAEAALGRVEPELKRLRNRFELHLEQVREAHLARGVIAEELSFEGFISRKIRLFESENRMAAMFSTLAGSVFGTTEPRPMPDSYQASEIELREDLDRVEQEASEALQALYAEYLALANEYDVFEIGLQPDNIQVIRRSLLWAPQK